MLRYSKVILFLLFSSAAWATSGNTCTHESTHVWHCATTGDAVQDGWNFRNFVAGANADTSEPGLHFQWACGDLIYTDAARYTVPATGGNSYGFLVMNRGTYNASTNPGGCVAPWQKTVIRGAGNFTVGDYRIPTLADKSQMTELFVPRGSAVACPLMCAYANSVGNYIIGPFFGTTDPAISGTDHAFLNGPMFDFSRAGGTLDDQPHDVILHHLLATNGEQETYGDLYACQSYACLLRSTAQGFHLAGKRNTLSDSTTYGLGGYDPTRTYTNITGITCTNASPTVCSKTGLAATLGVVGVGAACVNTNDSKPWCSQGCENAHGCTRVMTTGAPAGNESYNGLKAATYVSANSVALDNLDGYVFYLPKDVTHVDLSGSTWGAGTASMQLTQAANDPQYQFQHSNNDDTLFLHNRAENGDMTINGPGGSKITATGIVQAGSTSSSIILADMQGPAPEVGGLLAVAAPGASLWCGAPGGDPGNKSCFYGLVRTAKITAISGTYPSQTLTVQAEGPQGIDVAPTATTITSTMTTGSTSFTVASATGLTAGYYVNIGTGAAKEIVYMCNVTGTTVTIGASSCPNVDGRGQQGTAAAAHSSGSNVGFTAILAGEMPSRLMFVRNQYVRDYRYLPIGKGRHETKACKMCIWDGNDAYAGGRLGALFLESKNQPPNTSGPYPQNAYFPYNSFQRVQFSNNVYGGANRYALLGFDFENTSAWGYYNWWANNIFLGIVGIPGAQSIFEQQGNRGGGWKHNTAMYYANSSHSIQPNTQLPNLDSDCLSNYNGTPTPYLDDYGRTEIMILDNLLPYGEGIAVSNTNHCWPNQASAVRGNAWMAIGGSKTTSDIDSQMASMGWNLLGNQSLADAAAAGLVGTCAFGSPYTNCALSAGSSLKGTATGGYDPGADVVEVADHQNGWSEAAGFIYLDRSIARFVTSSSAVAVGAKYIALRFKLYNGIASCSVIVYTDAKRLTEHGDTNSSGKKACNRSGNLYEDNIVTFVLGSGTNLTAATKYSIIVNDGARQMALEVRTRAAEPSGTIATQLFDSVNTDARIQFSANADMSSSSTTSAVNFASNRATVNYSPASGVRYYRWQKRLSGTVVATGPIQVAFR